jgi:hypothetical protein
MPSPTPADRLNELFASAYHEHVERVIAGLDDVLVVHSTPLGGHYAHYHNGVLHASAEPVPASFRILKSIGHGPTAIPALTDVDGAAAAAIRAAADETLDALPGLDVPPDAVGAAEIALRFTAESAGERFDHLPKEVTAACEALITAAGAIQGTACRDLVAAWRHDMGAERWSRAYGIVGTGWATKEHGTHYEVLVNAFGTEALGVRLFSSMGEKDEARLLRRIGVILANRGTCEVVLGDPHRMDVELIGDAVQRALEAPDPS